MIREMMIKVETIIFSQDEVPWLLLIGNLLEVGQEMEDLKQTPAGIIYFYKAAIYFGGLSAWSSSK